MKKLIFAFTLCAVALAASAVSAQPVLVGFQNAAFGSDGDDVASFTRLGTTVTVEGITKAGSSSPLMLAESLDGNFTAFEGLGLGKADDLPFGRDSERMLTDGIGPTKDYLISFSSPVANVRLDLIDYRADGPNGWDGPHTVDVVTNNGIAMSYTVDMNDRGPDGAIVQLAAMESDIDWVKLDFNWDGTIGRDGGTAIDNLAYIVPEPSSLVLAFAGLFGLIGAVRRSRKNS